MFDEKTEEKLKYYVYGLINPLDGKLFYVGKGTGNRVFMHLKDAIKEDSSNLKLDIIRSVISEGREIKHLILRHGLSEKEAFEVESTLIDFGDYFKYNFSNIVAGTNSDKRGIMTSNEIIRKYNSKPLKELLHPVIIININKKYNRGINPEEIYKATKEAWVIGDNKTNIVKYALAEFEGIIIEVYKIKDWYRVKPKDFNDRNNDFKIKANSKVRWGFDGDVAEKSVRTIYLNKSIAHVKKQGAANPIRYTLDKPNPYLKINNKQSKRIVKLNKVVKVRTENRMKIGAFVQDSFRKAYEQNLITEDEIKRLQNPEYSKRIFNAGFEVLRLKSASIKDGGGRTRYYAKELFCEDYHLSQQWKETQRDSFLMWLKQIGYSN
tara:strand:- start:127 stop:1263 length:1137 start_codon:yes stop_codon:yes gene_type:complete